MRRLQLYYYGGWYRLEPELYSTGVICQRGLRRLVALPLRHPCIELVASKRPSAHSFEIDKHGRLVDHPHTAMAFTLRHYLVLWHHTGHKYVRVEYE